MDADWYVDPLERYEGRFFDGVEWTDRVSDGGVLTRDPDFVERTTEQAPRTQEQDEFAEPEVQPAVARVVPAARREASTLVESPVRVVAVLSDSVVKGLGPADSSAGGPAHTGRSMSGSGRARLAAALLALVAALAIVGWLYLRTTSDSTDAVAAPVALDAEQEERVEDLEAAGTEQDSSGETLEPLEVDAPEGSVAPDAVFDPSETVQVGSLRVVNGASLLDELASWHQGFAAERGITLDPQSGCWFGELGGAAEQAAHCGPVGGSADTEFLFDKVPLQFDDRDDGQIAQPVVDDATADARLPNALVLVGADGGTEPPESLRGETRGNRATAQSDDEGDS